MTTILMLAAAMMTVEPGGLSVVEAVARVRALRAQGDAAPKTIAVKGTNRLTETLVFTEDDHDLAFVGEDGASFSGGIEIAGWRETEPGVWEADAPKTAAGETMFFDQLWVNGRRAPCARLPNEGPLCGDGVRKIGGIRANNLWWDVRGEAEAKFDGLAWPDWKASGKETGGVFADPRFVDPEVGDGRFQADSPAFALGFKPFDTSLA